MAAITHRLRCEFLESRRLMTTDVADSMGISVQASTTAGVRAAEIRLEYDTQSLDISSADIRPGEMWQGRASLISSVDEVAGLVHIFLFTAEPIVDDIGSLVDLQFDVQDAMVADVSSASISKLRLNEGAIEATSRLVSLNADVVLPESSFPTFVLPEVVQQVAIPLNQPELTSLNRFATTNDLVESSPTDEAAPAMMKACSVWTTPVAVPVPADLWLLAAPPIRKVA